jgi:hypothetical protein
MGWQQRKRRGHHDAALTGIARLSRESTGARLQRFAICGNGS